MLHTTLRGWQMRSTWPRCRSRSPARVVATAVLPLAWPFELHQCSAGCMAMKNCCAYAVRLRSVQSAPPFPGVKCCAARTHACRP